MTYNNRISKCKSTGILMIAIISVINFANGDLYNSSDPLVSLNITNFNKTILGTENAWIVEFYASWCGHCINFAPTWREFSFEVMDWDHTIKVAVVDCADEKNGRLCKSYEVTSYPTIKIFGTNTQPDDRGTSIVKGSSQDLQQGVITFLMSKQAENSGSDTWVNLLPYEYAVRKILDYAPLEAEHAVLIAVDEPNAMIASQCILDLGNYKTIYVRSINADSLSLDPIDIPSIPGVIVIDKTGKHDVLQGDETTREEITALIMHQFRLQRRKFENKAGGRNVINEHEHSHHHDHSHGDETPEIDENVDRVYMVDIENTLSYALSHEVALKTRITGNEFQALVNFTNVLVKYLPTRPQVHKFLTNLNDFLKDLDSITGNEFEEALSNLQSSDSVLPDMQSWKGCLGSDPKYRGYPCGLWTTFHTLTVNAVLRERNNFSYDPKEVMRAIHGFVKYFFTCEDCSQHFQQMYGRDAEYAVRNPNDEIMWLWKSHNEVNMRVKGDESEDPKHLKQQFPTMEKCQQCWRNGDFNEEAVNNYLKRIYGESAISNLGTQDLSHSDHPDEDSLTYGSAVNLSSKSNHIVSSFLVILLYFGCFSML